MTFCYVRFALGLFVFASVPLHAQPLDANAERARIDAARKRVEQRYAAEHKECNALFRVTDCVNEAKARRRVELADLRRQEIALNDADRKARAAAKQKELEERDAAARKAQAEAAQQPARPRQEPRAKAPEADPAKLQRAPSIETRIREHEAAQERARKERAAEAVEKRAAYEKRQQDAAAHRAKVEKRLAERKKPAASDLPPPPAR
jgi:hypothetical protein